jgi:hypothetical protein
MKRSLIVCVVLGLLVGAGSLPAQTTVFAYHGRLLIAGQPANGSYDMKFSLADAAVAGNYIGNSLTNGNLPVVDGAFAVLLDFGEGAFDGSPRWLEIGVRTNGSAGAYAWLAPRQAITATPYAAFANKSATAVVAANVTPGAAIVVNGAGITNLNGANIQAGTLGIRALDMPTSNKVAQAGSAGTSLPNALTVNRQDNAAFRSPFRTPPMGICTWPLLQSPFMMSAANVRGLADGIYTNGLVGYGWQVLQLDGDWQYPYNGGRDTNGNLAPNTFLDFTNTLAYIKERGLLLGLYHELTPGNEGMQLDGNYLRDARSFKAWDMKYLKVDIGLDTSAGRFLELSNLCYAFDAVGLSAYVVNGSWGLNPTNSAVVDSKTFLVTDAVRLNVDGDLYLSSYPPYALSAMLAHFHHGMQAAAAYTRQGKFIDLDFINLNYVPSSQHPEPYTNWETAENILGLWAMAPAPLMVDSIRPELLPLYTNTRMIAIDQDPLCLPSHVVTSNANYEVWTRPLENGNKAAILINKSAATNTIAVNLVDLGLPAPAWGNFVTVYGVWENKALLYTTNNFSLPVKPYYAQLLLVSPCNPTPAPSVYVSTLATTNKPVAGQVLTFDGTNLYWKTP